MPIHLDPNSLVTSPGCDTMRDSTVPGDSDTDSSALPEVVMDSSSPLCCTAAPPLPLCLESTPHPSGHSCSSPAGMDRWELGTSRARPRWRAVSPLCPAHVGLVQTLHPHGAPQVVVGVSWGHGHWVHTSPLLRRAGRDTRARPVTGGRNGSLAVPRNCAGTAVSRTLRQKAG